MEFCVQTIRFNKFLENARSLLDLFADGLEKLTGEYIFDRYYVVSLVDSMVERLGMMVYDASVLAPAKRGALYTAYDRQKRTAGSLIGAPSPPGAAGADDTEDPEYRLLSDALQWFNGTVPPGDTTVMDFMKQSFLFVMQGMASADILKTAALFDRGNFRAEDMEIYVVNLWRDSLSVPTRKRGVTDFSSIPLRHLLMETGRHIAGGSGDAVARDTAFWVAAVDDYQLSLSRLAPGVCFRLETLASGHDPSDFIFIFTDRPALLEKILPDGFHVEPAGQGSMAWRLDIPAEEIEKSLAVIGHHLFDETLWAGQ